LEAKNCTSVVVLDGQRSFSSSHHAGAPERFAPLIKLYRDTRARRAGRGPSTLAVSINSHVWIADDSRRAADEFYPSYADVMSRIGRERGWPPTTRAQFEALRSPRGSLLVGSPQEVIDKMLYEDELFGNDRFLAQLTVGSMPHDRVMHAIELLGTVVAPAVRHATASSTTLPGEAATDATTIDAPASHHHR
jgi:alkanesulfonate monooxygenase SsuD/methylene tetrahydromethanopterin reductase-like flavin-dependent oxidoreductase (luciferase family)